MLKISLTAGDASATGHGAGPPAARGSACLLYTSGGGKPDQGIRHREAAFAAALDQRGQSRSSQSNAFVMAAHGLKNEGKILLCAQTGGMSVPKLPAQYLPCLAQRFDRFLAAVQGVQASAHALQQQGTAGRRCV